MPHSPVVSDAIAALISPLDTSERSKTVAAAPEQDGHGLPTGPAPQPLRPRAAILRDLTSLATGAGRAAAGRAGPGRVLSALFRAVGVPVFGSGGIGLRFLPHRIGPSQPPARRRMRPAVFRVRVASSFAAVEMSSGSAAFRGVPV